MQRRAVLANTAERVIYPSGGVSHEECNASKYTGPYPLHWTFERRGAQLVSAEMMMRLVFLGVIAALLLIGFSMGKDGYRAPQGRPQPAAPEAGTPEPPNTSYWNGCTTAEPSASTPNA